MSPYTHCPARWAAPVQVHGPTAGARGWKPSGRMPGGRPGRRGPVERPPGRWAQRAAEALAKGHERTRASRARRPRPFTNRSEISPTARPGVGGHEGLPGMPSGRSWPARAGKISKKPLTGPLWHAGAVVLRLSGEGSTRALRTLFRGLGPAFSQTRERVLINLNPTNQGAGFGLATVASASACGR